MVYRSNLATSPSVVPFDTRVHWQGKTAPLYVGMSKAKEEAGSHRAVHEAAITHALRIAFRDTEAQAPDGVDIVHGSKHGIAIRGRGIVQEARECQE